MFVAESLNGLGRGGERRGAKGRGEEGRGGEERGKEERRGRVEGGEEGENRRIKLSVFSLMFKEVLIRQLRIYIHLPMYNDVCVSHTHP